MVGAESQYANLLQQIGGKYVRVTSILTNPNADPHSFEASASVARDIAQANLIVQNGLGYDGFMNVLEAASSNHTRRVIDVQKTLHVSAQVFNPHLWYDVTTMQRLVRSINASLDFLSPGHKNYFDHRGTDLELALQRLRQKISNFRDMKRLVSVAPTEPVADYLIASLGIKIATSNRFMSDVMSGTDPAPQDVDAFEFLLTHHRVGALIYNEQVVDPVTEELLAFARQHDVPVVAVYETEPPSAVSYQAWMTSTVNAILDALISPRTHS